MKLKKCVQLSLSLILFVLFQPLLSEINGIPFIRNYGPKEYKANSQNWTIVQDNRGIMYFGNSAGILEYDGVNWRLIKTKDDAVVRMLAKDKKDQRKLVLLKRRY